MIEVSKGRKGFYSIIIWYLVHCHHAELNDDDILIDFFSPYYYDPPKYHLYKEVDRGFLQYFENPMEIVDKSLKYHKRFENINNIQNIIKYKDTEISGFILEPEMRKYMKFLIDKYLKIKPHILEKINKYSENFKNKKVLGVHIRQTDLYTSHLDNKPVKPLNMETYIEKIKENNFDLLYLMSDNIESINKMKEHFENIFYIEDIIRSEKEKDQLFIRKENSSKNKYKFGEDVLVETEILSKCNKILITNSNISSFALANNPDIKFEYLDLDIKG